MNIQEITFSPDVIEKIEDIHGLTQAEVEEAVFSGRDYRQKWAYDKRHGRRLLIEATHRNGKRIFIALLSNTYREGQWECITAFFPDREGYYDDQKQQ